METEIIKIYSLTEMEDKYIGKTGTVERYEYELRMDVLGEMINSNKSKKKT